MLDEDKTVKRVTLDNWRQVLDPYYLQERIRTPYVALIPLSPSSPDVLLSMSDLYPRLCFIKDLLKLRSGGHPAPLRRLSAIPPILGSFPNNSHQNLFLRNTLLQSLPTLYEGLTPLQLIDDVLSASSAARMRDLPAYFLCSTSLQKCIRKYLLLPPS